MTERRLEKHLFAAAGRRQDSVRTDGSVEGESVRGQEERVWRNIFKV